MVVQIFGQQVLLLCKLGLFNSLDIEAQLDKCPGVQESAVIGIPDVIMGESVVAIVMRNKRHNPPVEAQQVLDYMRTKVVSYCVPQYVFFMDQFPRNSAGKTFKPALRTLAPKLVGEHWNKVSVPKELSPEGFTN